MTLDTEIEFYIDSSDEELIPSLMFQQCIHQIGRYLCFVLKQLLIQNILVDNSFKTKTLKKSLLFQSGGSK